MRKMALALCFLFIAFTTKPFLTAAEPVLDSTGEPLLPGRPYYIVSAIWGAGGGGVTLAAAGNNTCATDIVQERSDLANGFPATFLPLVRPYFVPESSRLAINFNVVPVCEDPAGPQWKVSDKDESTGLQFLSVGASEPGGANFMIKKSGSAYSYKLVHCPADGSCQDIGKYSDGPLVRLALRDTPFTVVFIKAGDYLRMKV